MACRLYAAGELPAELPGVIAHRREHGENLSDCLSLTNGLEYVEAAESYAEHMPITHRYLLWRDCDERRRLYRLAQEQTALVPDLRDGWVRDLRQPWRLADEDYRKALLQSHGVDPMPHQHATRKAA
jgi:hypothetical protein